MRRPGQAPPRPTHVKSTLARRCRSLTQPCRNPFRLLRHLVYGEPVATNQIGSSPTRSRPCHAARYSCPFLLATAHELLRPAHIAILTPPCHNCAKHRGGRPSGPHAASHAAERRQIRALVAEDNTCPRPVTHPPGRCPQRSARRRSVTMAPDKAEQKQRSCTAWRWFGGWRAFGAPADVGVLGY